MKKLFPIALAAALFGVACVHAPKPVQVVQYDQLPPDVYVEGAGGYIPSNIGELAGTELLGQTGVPGYVETSQSLTGSVPTATTTGWFALDRRFTFIRAYVCAGSGQTLSGAGTLQAYWRFEKNDGTKLVMRNPSLDLTVSVTATSCTGSACRCQVFTDRRTGGVGSLFYVPSGVTLSSGSTAAVGIVGGIN